MSTNFRVYLIDGLALNRRLTDEEYEALDRSALDYHHFSPMLNGTPVFFGVIRRLSDGYSSDEFIYDADDLALGDVVDPGFVPPFPDPNWIRGRWIVGDWA